MKNLMTVSYISIAALVLTVACSSTSKVEDQAQGEPLAYSESTESTPMPESPEASSMPEEYSSASNSLPEEVSTESASEPIPDEVAQVASLGASSSGRSR